MPWFSEWFSRIGPGSRHPPPRDPPPRASSKRTALVCWGIGGAVECACAIRVAVGQLGLDVRIGVHTGEVEVRGDDIGGIAVHIAARVAEQAEPRAVWVSRTVTDLVAGSELRFIDRGEHDLKGVPGTWHLYAVQD